MQQSFLNIAYEEALKAYEKGEVPVGAVLVKNNRVIARGHNQYLKKKCAIYHAEQSVILKACKKLDNWRLDGCVLYSSLEPCLMCTGAIIQSRIGRIIFSALDEKAGCIISQYSIIHDKILATNTQYEYLPDDRSVRLLKKFFKEKRRI
ncbi:MAG: nucleoside deaminase [Candidatus Margulisbacteria bacterium]|nr:nucleoside deaminase [Candidatus Margulisiibacteriota bacterium]